MGSWNWMPSQEGRTNNRWYLIIDYFSLSTIRTHVSFSPLGFSPLEPCLRWSIIPSWRKGGWCRLSGSRIFFSSYNITSISTSEGFETYSSRNIFRSWPYSSPKHCIECNALYAILPDTEVLETNLHDNHIVRFKVIIDITLCQVCLF